MNSSAAATFWGGTAPTVHRQRPWSSPSRSWTTCWCRRLSDLQPLSKRDMGCLGLGLSECVQLNLEIDRSPFYASAFLQSGCAANFNTLGYTRLSMSKLHTNKWDTTLGHKPFPPRSDWNCAIQTHQNELLFKVWLHLVTGGLSMCP